MFQASSVYKSCKLKLSAAYGNYSGSGRLGSARVGSARLTCDYKAISVQLQLTAGTELGHYRTCQRFFIFFLIVLFQVLKHLDPS